jgi:hypothetical protein
MFSLLRSRTWPAAVALLALAVPALAAPAPAPTPQVEKYLLDDAEFVLTVNVKQIVASPAFTKQVQKQVEAILKMDAVQPWLKEAGFDPLKDVERLTVATGSSCWAEDPTKGAAGGGPYVIVEGKFDVAKLQATAEKAAKDFPNFFKLGTIGDAKVLEVGPAREKMTVAVLNDNTVVMAPFKEQIAAALDKAAGKKKTQLKNASLQKLMAKWDAKQAVNVAAIGEMVTTRYNSTTINNGVQTTKTVQHTFAEEGVQSLLGGLTVGDDIKGSVTITTTEDDKGKNFAANFQKGLAQGIEETTREAARNKEMAPLVEMLKSIKVTVKDRTITIEGHGGAETVEALIKSLFWVGRAEARPVPVQDIPKK